MSLEASSEGARQWAFPANDYRAAVVRLATVSVRRVQHLVWGAVELVPTEVPVPACLVDHWANAPGTRGLTLVYGQTAMSVAEGLAWYEAARDGQLHVPRRAGNAVHATPFASEPAWGALLAEVSAPFAAPWHDGPRIHRLVPMSDVALEVSGLRGDGTEEQIGVTEAARRRRRGLAHSREWFARRIGFDAWQWDDWLGAVALIAPNPLCRTLLTSIHERCPTTGAETILVEAEPREGADLSTLTVELLERRADGWARSWPFVLDAYGRGIVTLGGRAASVGLTARCNVRGLLAHREPAPFWRTVNWSMGFAAQRGRVAVPSGGRARPAATQDFTFYDVQHHSIGEAPTEVAVSRLSRLVSRREVRRGTTADDELIFVPGDRERAVDFIRARLGRATTRALVVDPFVEPRDLYEFGIQDRRRGLATTFLRSPAGLNAATSLPDLGTHPLGHHLQLQTRHLRGQLGADAPVVLLMNTIVFHDRLLVVDDAVWMMGHSLNQVGLTEISTMVRLRAPEAMLSVAVRAVQEAQPIDRWEPPPDQQSACIDGFGI
ncbi:VPA1262 family N-terminal domain-containing protein [Methylorubrum extorquens]|uniref:Uncharacterized protein n=1 Tax=Methylorubrum extorquens (strain CM4 / NCIMB 13688) TaxID=440085 RepID=B7L3H1_METC4|nr:VPA1262 family N-terminal domain-containing protein [Methylorubrum extorquens]ACK86379.1 hypothetical protein Mchl_5656 [Methylorubrum extorquens CM4]